MGDDISLLPASGGRTQSRKSAHGSVMIKKKYDTRKIIKATPLK
jgi:hypothetical protein